MKGEVVVITSSTGGIGLGIDKKFASVGAWLMINEFAGKPEIDKFSEG